MQTTRDSIARPRQRPDHGFTLHHRPARAAGQLAYWTAIPHQPRGSQPPLVAVHGVQRGARDMAEAFGAAAAARGQVVIAPVFDKHAWPAYQRVVIGGRADLALIALLDEVAHEGIADTRRFRLFGYSGGAQFAHRFAMLYPHRIADLVAAAAGWYTMPSVDAPFPYGLATEAGRRLPWGPRFAAGLGAFLRLPITVLVGENDDVADRRTRSGPLLDARQGGHRLARARRWSAALTAAAQARRLPPSVDLHILPGCAHDFLDCARHGGLIEHAMTPPAPAAYPHCLAA